MAVGWIRAYTEELATHGFRGGSIADRRARALFREAFTTTLRAAASDTSAALAQLPWGTVVELPNGIESGAFTAATFEGQSGFVRTGHVVEIAYVARRGTRDRDMKTKLTFSSGGKSHSVELIWGDCVQVRGRDGTDAEVRARGLFGKVPEAHLTSDPLLELYFIDVGQGDGVLVRTPDGRHLLIDGGLERAKQQSGKSAADFVDWKFFRDYGDFRVRLASMLASHSDNDHYGGLQDLVRDTPVAIRELDCLGTDIDVLHHPGLSRWVRRTGVTPPHRDDLGPNDGTHFVRLLGDRQDAEASLLPTSADRLSRDWGSFFEDVLGNSPATRVERVGVDAASLSSGGPLPELWPAAAGCSIKVLGPVTETIGGVPALRDIGDKGKNTNGHSICLRIDFGNARILLTGDLNKPSMDHLRAAYGDRVGAFTCDVAKACHHGSDDISYRFLEVMRAAATVISSGDAEGHAHPRPEIVAASAVSGFVSISRDDDRLLTPLVYMTEIERSVSLGAVNRIDFANVPTGAGAAPRVDGMLPGRHRDELSKDKQLSPTEQSAIDRLPSGQQKAAKDTLGDTLAALEASATAASPGHSATYYYTVAQGPLNAEHKERPVWRSRIMDGLHYGLVNVRTDGELILCATMDEKADDWILHAFPARFSPA